MRKKKLTALDVLKRMRWLLTNKGWTQKSYAKTANGRTIGAEQPNAARFCLYGAALRAQQDIKCAGSVRMDAEQLVRLCVPEGFDVISFNDSPRRQKSEILQVVFCAITKASASK